MDIEIVRGKLCGGRVDRDVAELIIEIGEVTNMMLVIAGVPNFLGRELASGVRVTTFDELNTFWERLLRGWRQEQMDMVRHDCECVELELAGISIAEQCLDEEIGVRFNLEVPMLEECGDRDSVSVGLLRAH